MGTDWNGHGLFDWVRSSRIDRSQDRWIGGVCGGIAERAGWSPTLVRGLMLGAVLLGGLGTAFYACAWAMLPDRETGRIAAEDLMNGRWDWNLLGVVLLLVIVVALPGVGLAALALAMLGGFVLVQWGRRDVARRRTDGGDPAAGVSTGMPFAGGTYPTPPDPNAATPGADGPIGASAPGGFASPAASPVASPVFPAPTAFAVPIRTASPRPPVRTLRRKPAGFPVVMTVIGLMLIAGAWLAIQEMREPTLTGQLTLAMTAVAWTCIALGVLIVALGCMGRRSGGLIPLAFAVGVLVVAVMGASVPYAYAVRQYDARTAGFARLDVGDFATIGSDPDRMAQLTEGVSVLGADDPWSGSGYYWQASTGRNNTSDINIDLTDYERNNGTHEVLLNDGTAAQSGCPAGTIRLAVRSADVSITLPDGCSYRFSSLSRYGCFPSAAPWRDGYTEQEWRTLIRQNCTYGRVSGALPLGDGRITASNSHVQWNPSQDGESDGSQSDGSQSGDGDYTFDPHYEWLQGRPQDPAEPELVIETPALMFANVAVNYRSDSTLPGYND